jgi:cold shock protein
MISSGKVDWFSNDRGYGFILRDGDLRKVQHWVHYSHIEMEGYKTLKAGEEVFFNVVKTNKGIQAQNVIPMGE